MTRKPTIDDLDPAILWSAIAKHYDERLVKEAMKEAKKKSKKPSKSVKRGAARKRVVV
jgi:hypothetical protein